MARLTDPGSAGASPVRKAASTPSSPSGTLPVLELRCAQIARRAAQRAMNEKTDDILRIVDVGLQTAAGTGLDRVPADECWRCLDRAELNELGVCTACDDYLRTEGESPSARPTQQAPPSEVWSRWLREVPGHA